MTNYCVESYLCFLNKSISDIKSLLQEIFVVRILFLFLQSAPYILHCASLINFLIYASNQVFIFIIIVTFIIIVNVIGIVFYLNYI